MKIELDDLTEAQVEAVTAELDARGFIYDEDYTALYGGRWKMVGVRIMPRAFGAMDAVIAVAIGALAEGR